MIDTLEYYKEKGKQAEQALLAVNCQKCNICQMWMGKEYIGAEGNCSDCAKKNEPFLNLMEE